MLIDAHTHIATLSDKPPLEGRKINFDKFLAEAKENDVSHLIVIAGYQPDDLWSGTTSELVNLTRLASNVSVVGSIDITAYQESDLEQLEAWLKEKVVVGVKIYTGYQHIYPSDERCVPIYKLCLKYDAPIIFHSGDTLSGYVQNPKVKYSHPLHIDEVAADYPDLKIVIAHMGNPWLIDCAEVLYKNPNVFADISGLVAEGSALTSPYGALMQARMKELLVIRRRE
jgi:predicted TIM-barrel fold metal-dependent hydrolase